MKNFTNYKYYTYEQDGAKYVVAVASFHGQSVKGIAKCDPEDAYDEDYGKKLAAAKCNEKIKSKRVRLLAELRNAWMEEANDAMSRVNHYTERYNECAVELNDARNEVVKIQKEKF